MGEQNDAQERIETGYLVVYLYRYWDPQVDAAVTSKHYATLDAIRAGLGTPIPESGIKVARTEVDPFGRYRPRTAQPGPK